MLALTLVNPMTILTFFSAFTSISPDDFSGDMAAALMMVVGVFFGSALWWLILSTGTALLRARMSERAMRWINRVSGAVLILFALRILLQAG